MAINYEFDKWIQEEWNNKSSQIKEINQVDLCDDNYSKQEIWNYICSLKNQIKKLETDSKLLVKIIKNPDSFVQNS